MAQEILTMKLEGPVLAKLKAASITARNTVIDAMRDASTVVMEATIREAPASTGTLRKSIRREFSGNGLRVAIFPAVDYGAFLHGPFEGGPTHSQPFVIPAKEAMPGGTLYRWAQKKGANPWAVRAGIKKRGIKFNPYMRRASESSEAGVQTVFEKALGSIASGLGD